MAKEMAQEAQPRGFQAVLDVFRKVSGRVVEDEDGVPTTVQFTGFTSPTDDVYAGLSNIFLPSESKSPPKVKCDILMRGGEQTRWLYSTCRSPMEH